MIGSTIKNKARKVNAITLRAFLIIFLFLFESPYIFDGIHVHLLYLLLDVVW